MEEGHRASDVERQRVVAALERHFADGRLTADELTDRVDRVLHARTIGELYELVSDLPELPVVDVPHRPVTSGRRWRRWRS
ncbi:MAG: DUF1707 SHOCT-like domain-containing protein [Acidimicrobiales bacterium]